MAPKYPQVILHLSDLHFSPYIDSTEHSKKELVLERLIESIVTVEDDWKPSIVCITGDITDKGSKEGYALADEWLREVSQRLGVGLDRFCLCPGNHDGIRDVAICPPQSPLNSEQADAQLIFPIPAYLDARFKYYKEFCKNLGVPAYHYKGEESYLIGSREIDGISFVGCNTSWFAFNAEEKQTLWLGLNYLQEMEAAGQMPSKWPSLENGPYIALMHHGTEEFFNSAEIKEYSSNRPTSLTYLWTRCHMALFGHSHENVVHELDMMKEHCWRINAGATCAGATHPNNVNLIRLNEDKFEIRTIEFMPSTSDYTWKQHNDLKTKYWGDSKELVRTKVNYEVKDKTNYTEMRSHALGYANSIIYSKSRQIKPSGVLPKIIDIKVEVLPPYELERDLESRDEGKLCLSFLKATLGARKTMLLGELGAGKSTLLAGLAVQLNKECPEYLPIFIPSKLLNFSLGTTIEKLFCAIDEFVAQEVAIGKHLNLRQQLADGQVVFLLVDGLDEVKPAIAQHLIGLLERLPHLYTGISIVASARPYEMENIDLTGWQRADILELSRKQRLELFLNERKAIERDCKEVIPVEKIMAALDDNPPLNAIANTPLSLRLLYPLLASEESLKDVSLAILLRNLLLSRLGEWATRDLKKQSSEKFCEVVTTPNSRAILLGALAFEVLCSGSLNFDSAKALLIELLPKTNSLLVDATAEEALNYFVENGLISCAREIDFPYHPFAEVAAGIYIENMLRNNEQLASPPKHIWRAVSFASGVARSSGSYTKHHEWYYDYVKKLACKKSGLVQACYVVQEARDEDLARLVVTMLPLLGRRPLVFFFDEKALSVRAVATTLVLAGRAGFEWLYHEYIAPITPPTHRGSYYIDKLFLEWGELSKGRLAKDELEQLRGIVPFLLAAQPKNSSGLINALVALVPDSFDNAYLISTYANWLTNDSSRLDAKNMLREMHQNGDDGLVNKFLLEKANGEAALLWLELNASDRPPMSLAETLLCERWRNFEISEDVVSGLKRCSEVVGRTIWKRFLRWSLSHSNNTVASAAALELFHSGEKSHNILLRVLVASFDFSSVSQQAEEVAKQILKGDLCSKDQGIKALFSYHRDRKLGSPDGAWRLFVSELQNGLKDGPQYLAQYLGLMGKFTLARNSDIRYAVKELLEGENASAYCHELEVALQSHLPHEHNAAAMILLVAKPDKELRSLIYTLNFALRSRFDEWREWCDFLLSLNYAPSILTSLHQSIKYVHAKARPLALAILLKNDVQLSDFERSEIILGQMSFTLQRNFKKCSIGSSFGKDVLLEELKKKGKNSAYVSRALLEHHFDSLNVQDRAKCYAEIYFDVSHNAVEYICFLRGLRVGDELFKALDCLANDGTYQTISIGLSVVTANDGWFFILRKVFCSGRFSTGIDVDDAGIEILNWGREDTAHAAAIGIAAQQILSEPSNSDMYCDSKRWLYVLVHEFDSLKKEDLESVLINGERCYNKGATYSLISRLGRVPESYIGKVIQLDKHSASDTCENEKLSTRDLEKKLIEYSLEADEMNPCCATVINSYIWNCDSNNIDIKKYLNKGRFGSLIATALEACNNISHTPDYAVEILKGWSFVNERQNEISERMLTMGRLSCSDAFYLDANFQEEYTQKVWEKAKGKENAAALSDYLRVKSSLTFNEFVAACELLFASSVNEVIANDIVARLVNFLLALDQSSILNLKDIATEYVDMLDVLDWYDYGYSKASAVYLFFSLLLWSVSNNASVKSVRVFARGVLSAVKGQEQSQRESLLETILAVEPLLERIPQKVFSEAFSELKKIPDPKVAVWGKLFSRFMNADYN
ncbi:metallophosphoesterase [Halodesulfovibrio aestuarii]|uniref:metallophosphoesterase n=1 Tax=Halodesulfovibrio aestuarii TaxID=126333 RepID=UPI003D33117D